MVKGRKISGDMLLVASMYAIVTIVAVLMLYPIINILAVSLSSYVEYLKHPWMLLPKQFNIDAYKIVFREPQIYRCYGNTIYITLIGTILGLIITTLTAYPLSRTELKGRSIVMGMIIFTMMFSAGMIPTFLNIRNLGLFNSQWALILPGTLGAFHCILMINFFKNIPQSLIEAAKIDSANEWYILTRIVIPLSGPVMATIALFKSVGCWNSYFSAQLYLQDRELWPVALLLKEVLMESKTNLLNAAGNTAEADISSVPSIMMQYAMLMITMIPIMCVYPFLQKYFAKGVMVGSVKG